MAYEMQKVNSHGANVPTLRTFIASKEIAKGALCGFSSGKLIEAQGTGVVPRCITLGAVSKDAEVLCEMIDPLSVIKAHCTGAVVVGTQYGVSSDGLEIKHNDTTYLKFVIISYDSTTGYAEAMPTLWCVALA
jgi:hypothetical protein